MRRLMLMITLLTTMSFGFLFAQFKQNTNQYPRFAELSPQDTQRLDQQRGVIAEAARKRYGTRSLTKTKADLPVLQKLIDDRVFDKSQTYQLQCLGVAFGDVMASELPLHWVMITDEFGTDPTLRFRSTNTNVNSLTMISKRIERDEAVNLNSLLSITHAQLSRLEKNSR